MMNMDTPTVHLRPITSDNIGACLALDVDEAQRGLVAPNVKSLAEAYVNRNLTPLATSYTASLSSRYDLIIAGCGELAHTRALHPLTCRR